MSCSSAETEAGSRIEGSVDGAWGSGSFDNDDAADWAYQLTPDADEGVVVLRDRLARPDA